MTKYFAEEEELIIFELVGSATPLAVMVSRKKCVFLSWLVTGCWLLLVEVGCKQAYGGHCQVAVVPHSLPGR